MAATATSIESELKQRERDYWDATLEGDTAALKKMTSDRFTFVMPDGVSEFGGGDFVKMMSAGDFKLTSYKFDPAQATVRELGRDAALIAYRVKWTYDREGKSEATDTYYTSIWVKDGGDWKYAAAAETPLSPKE